MAHNMNHNHFSLIFSIFSKISSFSIANIPVFGKFFVMRFSDRYTFFFAYKNRKSRLSLRNFLSLLMYLIFCSGILYNTLSCHSIYNFFKSGNVSTCYIVAFHSITFCSIYHVVCDVDHDLLKLAVYFFECPAQSFAVL